MTAQGCEVEVVVPAVSTRGVSSETKMYRPRRHTAAVHSCPTPERDRQMVCAGCVGHHLLGKGCPVWVDTIAVALLPPAAVDLVCTSSLPGALHLVFASSVGTLFPSYCTPCLSPAVPSLPPDQSLDQALCDGQPPGQRTRTCRQLTKLEMTRAQRCKLLRQRVFHCSSMRRCSSDAARERD